MNPYIFGINIFYGMFLSTCISSDPFLCLCQAPKSPKIVLWPDKHKLNKKNTTKKQPTYEYVK